MTADPRIRTGSPDYVVAAAPKAAARNKQESFIIDILAQHPYTGSTSKELAEEVREALGDVPFAARGQVNSRLMGLFEKHLAAPRRKNGHCRYGDCLPHNPPESRHRPTDPCSVHGDLVIRNSAAIWDLVGDAS